MNRPVVTLLILTLTVLAPVIAEAMPHPSWDFAAVEKIPAPEDPHALEEEARFRCTVSVDDGVTFLADRSFATMWTPTVARAWLFRYADNNLFTDRQFSQEWEEQKADLRKYLTFQIYLYAEEYEYAAVDGLMSKIINVVLIDDTGQRYAPTKKVSGDPEVDWYGDDLLTRVYNEVSFPRTDSKGTPIIKPTTEYLDLYVTCAEGKARFRFYFWPSGPLQAPAPEPLPAATEPEPQQPAVPVDEGGGDAGHGFRYGNVSIEMSPSPHIFGDVENANAFPYNEAAFVIQYFGADDKLMSTDHFVVRDIEPGADAGFWEEMSVQTLPKSYRIEFESGEPGPPPAPRDAGGGWAGGGFSYRDVAFDGNADRVEGVVEGIADLRYSTVEFEIVFYDAEGSPIGSEQFVVEDVHPNSSGRFVKDLQTAIPGPFTYKIQHLRDS